MKIVLYDQQFWQNEKLFMTTDELENDFLQNLSEKTEEDALKEDFDLRDQLIKARLKAGKTQEEVAILMKTTTSVIGRLETGGGKRKHSPTLKTLRRYAKALGYDLKIKLVQHHNHQ